MDTITPNRFYELFLEFHKRFPDGGFLHAVTDDGNWETKYIISALMHWKDYRGLSEIKWMEEHENDLIEMCSYILNLKERKRYKIWDDVKEYEKLTKGEEYGRKESD